MTLTTLRQSAVCTYAYEDLSSLNELDVVHPAYMKGRATRTWAMHKIQQVLSPSEMPMMMDEFKAEVDLMFADLN